MTTWMMRILIVFIVVIFGAISAWALLYPSPVDPKNIKYVLWKTGLYHLNTDVATSAMIGDASRDKLVLGKSKTQLRDKFGPLTPAKEASTYLRGCYESSPWKNKDVLFIGQSAWMVVFDTDKATNLVLIKGC